MSEMTPADLVALQNGNNDWNNNPFIYFVWMMFMRWFNNDGTNNGAITRAELNDGFNTQDILGNQRSIIDGISNTRYDNLSNVMNLSNGINNGFYGVNAAITDARYSQQSGTCSTNQAIKDLGAQNYQNTCQITTAIHEEGEATRALINANTMQNLRDQLAERDRDLMTSELFSAQQAQTQNLIAALRPFPIPSYTTCSPYTSASTYCTGGSCGA